MIPLVRAPLLLIIIFFFISLDFSSFLFSRHFSIIEMGGRGGLNFSFDLSKIVGPYESTPISYQNLLLERKSTGKSPVFVGPVLIHYKKDERTYKDFLSKLKSLRPGLQNAVLFGTDGEMALVNALRSCFPKGTEKSLRCFRHFRQNVEATLNKGNQRNNSKRISMGNLWKGFI